MQYLASNESHDKLMRDFNPGKHLRNGLVGTIISYAIFLGAVTLGWNTHTPTGFDFISLAMVAFVWLGLTTMVAWELPSEYRTRKIVYSILKNKHA